MTDLDGITYVVRNYDHWGRVEFLHATPFGERWRPELDGCIRFVGRIEDAMAIARGVGRTIDLIEARAILDAERDDA